MTPAAPAHPTALLAPAFIGVLGTELVSILGMDGAKVFLERRVVGGQGEAIGDVIGDVGLVEVAEDGFAPSVVRNEDVCGGEDGVEVGDAMASVFGRVLALPTCNGLDGEAFW